MCMNRPRTWRENIDRATSIAVACMTFAVLVLAFALLLAVIAIAIVDAALLCVGGA